MLHTGVLISIALKKPVLNFPRGIGEQARVPRKFGVKSMVQDENQIPRHLLWASRDSLPHHKQEPPSSASPARATRACQGTQSWAKTESLRVFAQV